MVIKTERGKTIIMESREGEIKLRTKEVAGNQVGRVRGHEYENTTNIL